MEKKWNSFIGIFVVIWISFILVSIIMGYLASIYDYISYNEYWVVYFAGFFIFETYYSGERYNTNNSHKSYLIPLFLLVIIAVVYYLLSIYVIIPWAYDVGWL
jgi:hypothetical protein